MTKIVYRYIHTCSHSLFEGNWMPYAYISTDHYPVVKETEKSFCIEWYGFPHWFRKNCKKPLYFTSKLEAINAFIKREKKRNDLPGYAPYVCILKQAELLKKELSDDQ